MLAKADFSAALKRLCSDEQWRALVLQAGGEKCDSGQWLDIRVAWQLRTPSFMASIRRINLELNQIRQLLIDQSSSQEMVCSLR